MPVMDGLELLREVKARYGELPFVMMTAYADVPSAVAAMREGAFDYVAKPFDNDELRAQVARALELARLKRENAACATRPPPTRPRRWSPRAPPAASCSSWCGAWRGPRACWYG